MRAHSAGAQLIRETSRSLIEIALPNRSLYLKPLLTFRVRRLEQQ
jgi:hypothetical protein